MFSNFTMYSRNGIVIFYYLSKQGLTSTQIGTLSTAQAQATTQTQRNALSVDQLNALSTAASMDYTISGKYPLYMVDWSSNKANKNLK